MQTPVKISAIFVFLLLLLSPLTKVHGLFSSEKSLISGVVISENNNEGIPFATIALFDSTGTELLGGTSSDFSGEFVIDPYNSGVHILRISAVGYSTVIKEIEFNKEASLFLGDIYLAEEEISIEGVIVTGQRIKAASGNDKTTFFVNQNMQKASSTGSDILRLIPGVHLDMRQNISLEGSSNILILVNGRERDRQYVSQLSASRIDKIEVISNPPAKYDASITGVINIILNNESERGISGNINAEIPVSADEVYLFPTYSLNYISGKFNIFTSYSGEMSYFNIEETYQRSILNSKTPVNINSSQLVKQKNWSHRFHYGADYFINEKNQLNFYGFVNPFSQEHDGISSVTFPGDEPYGWTARKDDDDRNLGGFNSLFYRHLFDPTSGHELAVDLGFYSMKGENTTRYTNEDTGYEQLNSFRPIQQIINARVGYNLPLSGNLMLSTGVQARDQKTGDDGLEDFSWKNRVIAPHSSLSFTLEKFRLSAGIRYESSQSGADSVANEVSAWMPSISAAYGFTPSRNLSFRWRQSISYPGLYHLNPNLTIEDPFTVHTGNPDLQPVRGSSLSLEYAHRFENHFVATRLFYDKMSGVINKMSILTEQGILESRSYNLGDISKYGVNVTAALALGPKAGIHPWISVFKVNSTPGALAIENNLPARKQLAWASGFSAFTVIGKDMTASVLFRHASPLNEIQGNYFEGAQYFISLERSFANGLKTALVSALPFVGQYTYRGTETSGPGFYNLSEGAIQMSKVPFWFRISYQFSSGTKRSGIDNKRESIENEKRKGF